MPKLITDGNLVGCFKGENGNIPFMTTRGVCKAHTIKNGILKWMYYKIMPDLAPT